MSTPNPLIPEGALPPSKGKSNVKIAIFTILAIHVVLLGGLLIQGCKPAAKTDLAKEESIPQLDLPTTNPDLAPSPTALPAADPLAPTPASAVSATPASLPVPTAIAAAPSPAVSPLPVAETAPASLIEEMKTHAIAKGEMLSTIAKKYKVSVKAIEDANPGVNPMRLQIGQKLNIPAPVAKVADTPAALVDAPADDTSVYVVKSGDMLERIARNNGTTVKAIKALNNLKSDRINVGQKIKLPARAASAPADNTSAAVLAPTAFAPVQTAKNTR